MLKLDNLTAIKSETAPSFKNKSVVLEQTVRGPRIHLTVMEVMPIVMRVAPVTTTQAVDMVSITVGPMDLAPVTVPATQLTTTTILGPAILHTRNS